jgi:branched-chain amino acid transport system substrate-binding protein
MNRAVMRFAALTGATALVFAGPVGAAKKTTKKKPAATTTTAAPVTIAPTVAPTTVAAPAAIAKPTGAAIKIGFISSETGNNSSSYLTGAGVAKVWAKWVNEEMGGIGGRPVDVLTVDGKNTAADDQAAAKDLVESKGVVALVLQDSTAESSLETYIGEKKFPVIGGSANNAAAGLGHGRSLYYFTTASSGPVIGEAPAIVANKLGQGPLTTAVCGEVPACAAGSASAEAKAKALGLSYAGNVGVLGSSPSYTAECLEIQSRNAASTRTAGFVSIALAAGAMARFVRDCNRQGYQGYFGASGNTAAESVVDKIDGLKLAGTLNGFPWYADAAPVKVFRDLMIKSKVEYRDSTATTTWSTLELFRKVMNKAGAPASKDDVLKAYWGVKDEVLDGLLPKPVTYTEGKPSPLLNCYWAYNYTNKKFAQLVLDGTKTGNGQTGDLRSYCG